MAQHQITSIYSSDLVGPAIRDSFTKLDPRQLIRNPVMFTTASVALLATVLLVRSIASGGDITFEAIVFWLWLRVLFNYQSRTSERTVCTWCAVNCKRAFIDVEVAGAEGRAWSMVPLEPGWERVIRGNSCPKGRVEDADEMRVVKDAMEEQRRVYPNLGEVVRETAFRCAVI